MRNLFIFKIPNPGLLNVEPLPKNLLKCNEGREMEDTGGHAFLSFTTAWRYNRRSRLVICDATSYAGEPLNQTLTRNFQKLRHRPKKYHSSILLLFIYLTRSGTLTLLNGKCSIYLFDLLSSLVWTPKFEQSSSSRLEAPRVSTPCQLHRGSDSLSTQFGCMLQARISRLLLILIHDFIQHSWLDVILSSPE